MSDYTCVDVSGLDGRVVLGALVPHGMNYLVGTGMTPIAFYKTEVEAKLAIRELETFALDCDWSPSGCREAIAQLCLRVGLAEDKVRSLEAENTRLQHELDLTRHPGMRSF